MYSMAFTWPLTCAQNPKRGYFMWFSRDRFNIPIQYVLSNKPFNGEFSNTVTPPLFTTTQESRWSVCFSASLYTDFSMLPIQLRARNGRSSFLFFSGRAHSVMVAPAVAALPPWTHTHTTRRTTWNAPPPHHHVPGQQARSCHNLNCVHWKKKKRWFLALTARLPGLLAYWL